MTRTITPSSPTEAAEAVQLDRVYPHPPEQVWRALTDPRRLAKWLMPNDFAPRVGHKFSFRDGRHSPARCRVVALEEARRLAYTWQRAGEPLSVVTWTLEPVGDHATRVRLTQTGPQACAFWIGSLSRLSQVLTPNVLIRVAPRHLSPILARSQR